jgi:hypothetical protein
MNRTLKVVIPGRPPTPNARPGNKWEHARWMETWVENARLAAQDAMRAAGWPLALERVGVPAGGRRRKPILALYRCPLPIQWAEHYVMVFVVPDRTERDWDNAVASSKPLTDGLVRAGVLAGDSTRYICSANRRTTFLYRHGVNAVEISIIEGTDPYGQLALPLSQANLPEA